MVKVIIIEVNSNGCWLWTGSLTGNGYAKCKLPHSRKTAQVHRLSLEAKLGMKLPNGVEACHACDTPACVNPEHTFPGTHKDNIRDCWFKGRGFKHASDSTLGAKLTRARVIEIRNKLSLRNTDLAHMYGVSKTCISNIRTGATWN